MKTIGVSLLISILFVTASMAQQPESAGQEDVFNKNFEALNHRLDVLEKMVDDLLWYEKAGDVALIDKVYITGPPSAKIDNPTAMGARNPVKFWCYIFIPRNIDRSKKYPLLVFPHGGVFKDAVPGGESVLLY